MAKQPNILDGESLEEFNALSETLRAEFEPMTESERTLVDMLVQHAWYMQRALRMKEYLSLPGPDGAEPDAKRISLIARYYKTHERGFAMAKRQLESLRKHKRRMEGLTIREAAATKARQRQWEQILKKMPPLTNWVN